MPQVNLLRRKLEVYGRFSTWEQKEQSGDSMPVSLSKSFTRYGAGFNYHFQRRAGGKPGAVFQLAWVRTLSRVEDSDPVDTFMAQFRFEWNAILNPPGM
jgi:hypothetical protein